MPEPDEEAEEAIDRASERARNAPPAQVDDAEEAVAREAARERRAIRRGRELQAPNMVGGTDDES